MKSITLEIFSDDDLELFEKWLQKDYILKWYENPDDWLYEVKNRNGEFNFIKHFIVKIDAQKFGFCQYYDCYHAQEEWYKISEPNRTYSIDYLIGEENYLNKGYGKEIIKQLIEKIKIINGKEIIVQPDMENTPSQRILTANGFIFDKDRGYYRLVV